MADYYDFVLGAIPASLVGLTLVALHSGFSVTVAIPLGTSVSLGLIGHAMFVNGPVERIQAVRDLHQSESPPQSVDHADTSVPDPTLD